MKTRLTLVIMCGTVLALGMAVCPSMVAAYDYGAEFIAHWVLSEADVTAFTSVSSTTYDANALFVTNFIRIIDFDCNSEFKITAAKSGWTLPANYPANGAKKADGSDSELLLMVDNVTSGYPDIPSEGLHALGAYTSYTAITTSGNDIIGGGVVGSHGVANAGADIHAKIPMDWAADIAGAYSITVTLTISEITE